jgi:hypothetical protein
LALEVFLVLGFGSILELTCVIVFIEFLTSRSRVGDPSKVFCLDRSMVVLL